MSTQTIDNPAAPTTSPSEVRARYALSTVRNISALRVTARLMEADLPRKVAHLLDVWERVARRILTLSLDEATAYSLHAVHADRTLTRIAQLETETVEGVAALRAKAARLEAGQITIVPAAIGRAS